MIQKCERHEVINNFLQHHNLYDRGPLYSGQKEPFVLFQKIFNESIKPQYSITIPVFNQEEIIKQNIESVIDKTHGTFEIIIILDACVDRTEYILLNLFQNIKVSTKLQQVLVIKQETPIFETACDNIGFKLSSGEYLLEIQSDMEMSQDGYNEILARGLEQYDDVIGISGRCTHKFFSPTGVGKLGSLVEQPLDFSIDQNKLYMYGTCNRGPLLLDHKKVRELNYLDAYNFFLDDSDHDLFARAILTKSWKCGYIPIEFKSNLNNGSTRKEPPIEVKEINNHIKEILNHRPNTGFLFKHSNLLQYIKPQIRQLK